MYFAGFSLDNLSLMALTIATGFVVDDAIVMIENIMRHIENGDKPMEAAYKGAGEIGFTIVSLTVSLIAVFIPLLFMTGIVGRLFREFALTLTIAVLTSMVIALTLTPMMSARLLRAAPHGARAPWYARLTEAPLNALTDFYRVTLDIVLRFRSADADRRRAHSCLDGRALPGHPERLPAGPGYRVSHRRYGDGVRRFVRPHEGVAEFGRGCDPQRPRRTRHRIRGRHRHHQRNAERRAFRPHLEAQERAGARAQRRSCSG